MEKTKCTTKTNHCHLPKWHFRKGYDTISHAITFTFASVLVHKGFFGRSPPHSEMEMCHAKGKNQVHHRIKSLWFTQWTLVKSLIPLHMHIHWLCKCFGREMGFLVDHPSLYEVEMWHAKDENQVHHRNKSLPFTPRTLEMSWTPFHMHVHWHLQVFWFTIGFFYHPHNVRWKFAMQMEKTKCTTETNHCLSPHWQ